jgi:hypothetical protein
LRSRWTAAQERRYRRRHQEACHRGLSSFGVRGSSSTVANPTT